MVRPIQSLGWVCELELGWWDPGPSPSWGARKGYRA